ncbi:MAG: PKD domain-containing protein [Promethearchaeota archaeon]
MHVAWEDKTNYSGAGNDVDIFYKYKNNGGSWSTTEVVSTESTEDSWYSSLMVDSDGVVHVAWNDDTGYGGAGSDTDIFYKYKSGGNEPPNKPTINGPTSGKAGTSYDYTLTSTDPDGDQVSYYIKWDDESITDWTAFQDSGPPGYSESHVWHDQGTYTIEAKAKDIYGAESDWATLDVTMPKTKTINANLQWIFQRFLNAFPILRYFFVFGV